MIEDVEHNDIGIFRQQCKLNGLKVTPKRMLIFKEMICSTDHPSPDMLYKRVKAKSPKISLDTVYRTMAKFHEIGLCDMVEGFTLTKRFDPKRENHHHARCTSCQEIIDFNNRHYDDLKIPAFIQKKFNISRVRVAIEGLCKKCQSAIKLKD